jgi:hypothetical protein
MFDFDGTLVKFEGFGKAKVKGTVAGWQWWHSKVPGKLKELWDEGFVFISLRWMSEILSAH